MLEHAVCAGMYKRVRGSCRDVPTSKSPLPDCDPVFPAFSRRRESGSTSAAEATICGDVLENLVPDHAEDLTTANLIEIQRVL